MAANKKKLFEIAKAELLNETEDNNCKIIYAYFGLAIFYSQSLELTLKNMLWSMRFINNVDHKDLNSIIDEVEFSKKTFGGLLQEIEIFYTIEKNIIKDLRDVLNQRNLLVHNYFNTNGQKLYSIKGKLEMLELFCHFIDKVKNLDVMLETYYKKNLISLGLSEKIIYDISTKMIDNEVSRDLNL